MAVHYTFDKGITLNDIRSNTDYEISKPKRARYYIIKKDDKVAQLVVTPIILVDFTDSLGEERGDNGFGSTDKK